MSRTQEQATGSITGLQEATEVLRSRTTVSVEEAAAILGLGRSTAYNAARAGELHAIKVQGRWLVPTAKLLRILGLDDDD